MSINELINLPYIIFLVRHTCSMGFTSPGLSDLIIDIGCMEYNDRVNSQRRSAYQYSAKYII